MRKLLVSILCAGAAVTAPMACRETQPGSAKGPPDAGSFDKPALLSAFGQCVLGNYRTFRDRAAEAEAAAKKASETPESLPAAQDAWKKAMDVWQEAEAMQLGPA